MATTAELKDEAQQADQAADWSRSATLYAQIIKQGGAGYTYSYLRAVLYDGRVAEAERLSEEMMRRPNTDRLGIALIRAEIAERKGDPDTAKRWAEARELGASSYWTTFGEARAAATIGCIRDAKRLMEYALTLPEKEANGIRFALRLDLSAEDRGALIQKVEALPVDDTERIELLLASLCGMTSLQERLTLYRAARDLRGFGTIVDLGPFLGSLTISMACGLRDNPRGVADRIGIHAYDRFLWHAPMDECWWDVFPGTKPTVRGSFKHIFDYLTAPWSDLITVVEDDVLHQTWNGPIELLSIDAMKTVEIARHLVATFYPSLVPGALVFHQDFGLDSTWWIHVFQYLLRHHFELADPVVGSSGILLRLTQKITPAEVTRVLAHDLADVQQAALAFDYSISLLDQKDHGSIAAVRAFYERDKARGALP